MTFDDAALIEGIRRNEQAAFTEFFNLHYPSLLSLIRSRMPYIQHEAEDVVQKAFINFFRYIGSFRGECSPKSFLARIALNLMVGRFGYLRRRHYSTTQSFDAPVLGTESLVLGDILADGADLPHETLEMAEYEASIAKARTRIPPVFRQVLELRLDQGKSYKAIATELGIDIGTVKSRIKRAREKVMTQLFLFEGEAA